MNNTRSTITKLVLVSSVLCAASAANAEGLFLGLGLGSAETKIDEPVFSDGDTLQPTSQESVTVVDFFAGYEWSNGVFVEGGYESYGNFAALLLGDAFELEAPRAGVGYYLPSDSKFHFMGKAGLNFWSLEARESFIFNPGPEETSKLDGTDLFVELGMEYRFNDHVRSGLSVSYADLDVGGVTAVKLTFKFLP